MKRLLIILLLLVPFFAPAQDCPPPGVEYVVKAGKHDFRPADVSNASYTFYIITAGGSQAMKYFGELNNSTNVKSISWEIRT